MFICTLNSWRKKRHFQSKLWCFVSSSQYNTTSSYHVTAVMAYILREWTGETKNNPSTAEQSNDRSPLSHILDTVWHGFSHYLLLGSPSIGGCTLLLMFITVLNTFDHLTFLTSGTLLGVEAAVKYKWLMMDDFRDFRGSGPWTTFRTKTTFWCKYTSKYNIQCARGQRNGLILVSHPAGN